MNRLQAWARAAAYLLRRLPRLRRALPRLALVALAFGLFAWGAGRETVPGVVVGTSALPLITVAVSWPVWRAVEREVPGPIRWRRLQRRICWRIAFLLLFAAAVAVVVIGYAYESSADPPSALQIRAETAARLLALAAPVPVLLDPFLWVAWTLPLPAVRRMVRSAWIVESLQDANRFRGDEPESVPAPGYDPDRGWSGRPMPLRHNEPPYAKGEPVVVRPAPFRPNPWHPKPSKREAAHHENVSAAWDGAAFVLTSRRRKTVRIPAERVHEVVYAAEYNHSGAWNRLMLLDSRGRRVATMQYADDFDITQLCALATAAGLPFSQYRLGRTDTTRTLSGRLFPRARGHLSVSAG